MKTVGTLWHDHLDYNKNKLLKSWLKITFKKDNKTDVQQFFLFLFSIFYFPLLPVEGKSVLIFYYGKVGNSRSMSVKPPVVKRQGCIVMNRAGLFYRSIDDCSIFTQLDLSTRIFQHSNDRHNLCRYLLTRLISGFTLSACLAMCIMSRYSLATIQYAAQ